MTTSPLDISRRFINEVWNARKLDVADELFTEATVTHELRSAPGGEPTAPRRPEDVKRELAEWFGSFPDIRVEIEYQRGYGDEVVTQCVFRGTHRGAWLGIAPTNREISVRMVLRQRVHRGKILEDWVLADWHGALAQLGVLPPLEAIARRPTHIT